MSKLKISVYFSLLNLLSNPLIDHKVYASEESQPSSSQSCFFEKLAIEELIEQVNEISTDEPILLGRSTEWNYQHDTSSASEESRWIRWNFLRRFEAGFIPDHYLQALDLKKFWKVSDLSELTKITFDDLRIIDSASLFFMIKTLPCHQWPDELLTYLHVRAYENNCENSNNAQSLLGWMYTTGKGVPQNERQAVKFFEMCAHKGLQYRAKWYLADAYRQGKGVEKNLETAVYWYQKASTTDSFFPHAAYDLAALYAEGKDVEHDLKRAFKLYRKAVKYGSMPEAQFCLGYMHERGLGGVPKNQEKAFKYCHRAAQNGFVEAQMRLGRLYKDGRDIGLMVPKNPQQAIRWHHAAAEQGDYCGQAFLYIEYKDQGQQDKAAYWRQRCEESMDKSKEDVSVLYALQSNPSFLETRLNLIQSIMAHVITQTDAGVPKEIIQNYLTVHDLYWDGDETGAETLLLEVEKNLKALTK